MQCHTVRFFFLIYVHAGKYFWHGSVTEQAGSSSSPRHSHGTRVHLYSAARTNLPEQRCGMAPHQHDVAHQGMCVYVLCNLNTHSQDCVMANLEIV